MTGKLLKLSYIVFLILGFLSIWGSLSLNIDKAGKGIFLDILIAWAAVIISERKIKTGLIIVGVTSIIEFISYYYYCSIWSAAICQRNLFVISATSIIFFGILWLAILISKAIMRIFGLDKTRRW